MRTVLRCVVVYMPKKYSSDMFFKKRFVWLCPSTRSLHWSVRSHSLLRMELTTVCLSVCDCRAKKAEDRFDKLKSKFLLVRMTRGRHPNGYFQGVVHSGEFNHSGLKICTESGKFLDLQVSPCPLLSPFQLF